MTKKPRKIDFKTPVHKADDWTRRAFIERAGTFLGVFGVSQLIRFELMEKMSKRIFGSSTAFAQGGQRTYVLSISQRAGFPLQCIFPTKRDAVGPTNLNRNFHAVSNDDPNGAIGVAPTTSGTDLILSPQASPLAPFASRIAVMQGFSNGGANHSNNLTSHYLTGGADFVVANSHAMSSIAAPILSQPLIFGDQNNVNYTWLGSVSPNHAPGYVASSGAVTEMFSKFQLSKPGGGQMSEALTESILGVLYTDLNKDIVTGLKTRSGGTIVESGLQKVQSLLKQDLSAQLSLTSAANIAKVAAMSENNGIVAPAEKFNMVDDPFSLMVTAGNLFSLGITTGVGIINNTGDWHNEPANQVVANPLGAGTNQAVHAAFWGQLLARMLTEFAGYNGPDGQPITNSLFIVFTSEFDRSRMNIGGNLGMGDNGDGDHQAIAILAPTGRIKGGTYGNLNSSFQWLMPNLTTGADGQVGQLDRAYMSNTIMKVLGLDPTLYGGGTEVISAVIA